MLHVVLLICMSSDRVSELGTRPCTYPTLAHAQAHTEPSTGNPEVPAGVLYGAAGALNEALNEIRQLRAAIKVNNCTRVHIGELTCIHVGMCGPEMICECMCMCVLCVWIRDR